MYAYRIDQLVLPEISRHLLYAVFFLDHDVHGLGFVCIINVSIVSPVAALETSKRVLVCHFNDPLD